MQVGRVGGWLVVVGCLSGCRQSPATLSSGQIGCDPSHIDISQDEFHPGFFENSQSWVAECGGKRFYCSKLNREYGSQVSCKEALDEPKGSTPKAEAKPTQASGLAPTGAAGFTLGDEISNEQRACEGAGLKWEAAGREFSCSGAVTSLGFDALVTLRACGSKVCGITLRHRPTSWMSFVADVKDKLQGKYGPPVEADDWVPGGCRDEDSFAQCLESGQLHLRYGWSWSTRERVALVVGQAQTGGSATVRIEYSKPVDSGL
jgi:hypothetical protein